MRRPTGPELATLHLQTIRAMLPSMGQTGGAVVPPAIPPVTPPLPLPKLPLPLRPLSVDQFDAINRALRALPQMVERLDDLSGHLAAVGLHPSQALDGSAQVWTTESDPTAVARHQLAALYASLSAIAVQGGVRRGH